LGGDTNCVLDDVADRWKPRSTSKMAQALSTAMADLGVCDIWRVCHPREQQFSFYAIVHDSFSRTDLAMISLSLLYGVEGIEYLARQISDHSPLKLEITLKDVPVGPKRWHLNQQLLNDQSFKEINEPTALSPQVLWESLKAYLRGIILAYSSTQKKRYLMELVNLEHNLSSAESSYYKQDTPESYSEWLKIHKELDNLSTKKAEYSLARTKARYYAQGDRAGRVLAWQLKCEATEGLIPSIQLENGQVTLDPKNINDRFVKFYKELYSTHQIRDTDGTHNFLDNIQIPQLSEETRDLLEGQITEEEILQEGSLSLPGLSP
uniref:Endonuclease/exonuclease/phosphatase domain-containing protein n=1 Tax=Latimeria chalumnae TaxID=7897 RepID=H3ANP7_LATCH